MKIICFAFVVVVFFAATTEAAVSQSPPEQVAGHEGKCWYEPAGWELNPGESRTDKSECSEVNCHDDFSMSFFTCGVIGPGLGPLTSDLTKDYPDCCPEPVQH